MRVAITTDHAGFEALKELKLFLESMGHDCVDFGPESLDMDDDYPDFMLPAARAVADGDCECGIVMGGSGQGEAMAMNRIKGVRCALFYSPAIAKVAIDAEGHVSNDPYEIIKLARQHNDANVLSLSGRFLTLDQMKVAIEVWFGTPFSGAERHTRRIRKLDAI